MSDLWNSLDPLAKLAVFTAVGWMALALIYALKCWIDRRESLGG